MTILNIDNVGKNKTKEYHYKLCKIFYALGAPNYWYGDLGMPEYVATIHDILVWIIDLAVCAYLLSLVGSNFTQHNLSEKQIADRSMFTVQPLWYLYVLIFSYYRKEVRVLGYELVVKLKEVYNDPQVEEEMRQCFQFYAGIFLFFGISSVVLYGVYGLVEVIFNGNNFITVVPVWPDVHDPSMIASVVRVAHYILFWIWFIRMTTSAYLQVILITTCLSHQYKNLCSYFRSLNDIFEEVDAIQSEKECKYEKAFIFGIELHNTTLRCKKQAEKICHVVFSFQIFINLIQITSLLFQLVNSERTLTNFIMTSVIIISILLSTCCFWCSAGDVTIEASNLSMAMFESGWQHCRGRATLRTRTLLGVAMWHSQRPVEIRCLGLVTLSYSSYVKIVRSTYQVFSVLTAGSTGTT